MSRWKTPSTNPRSFTARSWLGQRPSPPYRCGTRKNANTLLHMVLPVISICLALTLAGITVWMYIVDQKKPLAYHHILLLDRSDPLSATQQRELESVLQTMEWETPDAGKVSVFYLDNYSGAYLKPEATGVMPDRHKSGLMSNEHFEEERYRKNFLPQIRSAVLAVQNATNMEGSSIAETLSKVRNRPDFSPDVRERRILLFSDLLQNSGLCNDHDSKRRCTADRLSMNLPDLRDVRVDILYLQRLQYTALQTQEHRNMWADLLRNAGARVRIVPIF